MGQGSKPAIWSTRGRLRWSKEWKYKEKNPYYKGGSRNQKEGKKKKDCTLKNCNCAKVQEKYTRTAFFRHCQGGFSLHKTIYSYSPVLFNLLWLLFNS